MLWRAEASKKRRFAEDVHDDNSTGNASSRQWNTTPSSIGRREKRLDEAIDEPSYLTNDFDLITSCRERGHYYVRDRCRRSPNSNVRRAVSAFLLDIVQRAKMKKKRRKERENI